MVDMSALVGSIRRFGLVGPPYEVLGPAEREFEGGTQMLIRLLETGEATTHPLQDILRDPEAD